MAGAYPKGRCEEDQTLRIEIEFYLWDPTELARCSAPLAHRTSRQALGQDAYGPRPEQQCDSLSATLCDDKHHRK